MKDKNSPSKEISRSKPILRIQITEDDEKAVVSYANEHPQQGQARACNELKKRGASVSAVLINGAFRSCTPLPSSMWQAAQPGIPIDPFFRSSCWQELSGQPIGIYMLPALSIIIEFYRFKIISA